MAFQPGSVKKGQDVYEAYELLMKRLKSNACGFFEKFQTLTSNTDRVNFAYLALKKYNLLPKFLKDEKNDFQSNELRKIGNNFFQGAKYEEAMQLYTRSALSAKSNNNLSLAYANRSASLLKLELYQECLTDIERALAHDYPQDLHPKLFKRRQDAEHLLRHLSISSERSRHEEIPQFQDSRKNSLIQCAKDCVEITRDASGCHIVATEDIQIGEVITVEKAFVCSLSPIEAAMHCHHCAKLCYNPLPCDICVNVAFCSEECKNNAQYMYHDFECRILLSVISCGMEGLTQLAIKSVLIGREYLGNFDALSLTEGEVYKSDRYKEVHNLRNYADKKPLEKLFRKAMNAAFIFELLDKHTNFFDGAENNIKDDFKGEMLAQLLVAQIHVLTLSEVDTSGYSNDNGFYGFVICPFSSLVTHSCVNNVEFYNYGSTVVVRALSKIKKGEECFACYTSSYDTTSRKVRREAVLDRFYFTCECKACVNNWSVDLRSTVPIYVDLQMSAVEFMSMLNRLDKRSVDAAKKYLKVLVPKLEKFENVDPLGNVKQLKDIIDLCYRILASRKPF